MAQFVDSQGRWWEQRPDGTWLRWDDIAGKWQEAEAPADLRTTQSPPPPPPIFGSPGAPDADPGGQPPPAATPPVDGHGAPPYPWGDRGPPAYPWGAPGADPPVALDRSARAVIVLLTIAAVVAVIVTISNVMQLALLERFASGEFGNRAEAREAAFANDRRVAFIGLLDAGVVIITGVVFLVWCRRAYENLPRLGARNLRYTPGWAVGAWIVPILNLWRPKQIMNDIWRASDPALPAHQGQTWQGRPVPALFNWWWAAYLLGVGGAPFGGNQRSLEAVRTLATIVTVKSIIAGVAAILAIKVVQAVTARQNERARAIGVQPVL